MKKRHSFLFAVCAALAAACEDGPHQTYSPTPAGAEERWNDGKHPGVSDPEPQGYGATVGGGSRQELCTGAEKAKRWAEMVNTPIKPPRLAGGLDFAGDDTWQGLTLEAAEKVLCQGDSQGSDGEDSFYSSWGDNGELLVGYSIVNHKIDFVQMNQGYKGTIRFSSRPGSPFSEDGAHTFEAAIGRQITRDGKPFVWDWQNVKTRNKQATELYDALMYSFGPELPSDTVDCKASGKCLLIPDTNGGGVFGARGVGFYIHIPSISKPQPIPSTPDYLYMFVVKLLPFSTGTMHLKLDQEGPILEALALGDRTPKADCVVKLGTKYSSLVDHCINVLGDPSHNQLNINKWLGGHKHNDESYVFSVVGVNFQVSSATLPESDIIHDDWLPGGDDWISEYVLDVRASGPVKNDLAADGKTVDLHGTAAIYREYARTVQASIHEMLPAKRRHALGAPECLLPAHPPAGFDPYGFVPADGCTGFEAMVTPAEPDTGDPGVDRVSLGSDVAKALGYSTVLRPGDPQIVFCMDPVNVQYCGGVDPIGNAGTLWDTSWRRVLRVLGKGNLYNLPAELRDRRYFFKLWAFAYVKYLRAAHLSPTNLGLPQLDVYSPDVDSMFFDAPGGGQERFEYTDRRFIAAEGAPLNVEYQAQLQSGNQQYVNYKRRLERPERALYKAMQTDKSLPAGAEENVLFSNVVGSWVLKNGYSAASDAKDAFFCATHVDAECMAVDPFNRAPVDKDGRIVADRKGQPMLARYRGAFGETPFTLGTTHLKLKETFQAKQNAWVEIPNWKDPYDPSSGEATGKIGVLTDWKPKQEQEGFPIPVNGTRSRFYPAASLDFTGEVTTYRFDYEDVAGDDGKPTGDIKLLAAETTDFLGDVFLCKDPVSGDLLSVRMYDSFASILDWIAGHPGVQDNCGLIVSYSPYNNYPDFLIALPAGTMLKVNSGSGFGRVGWVEAYTPGL